MITTKPDAAVVLRNSSLPVNLHEKYQWLWDGVLTEKAITLLAAPEKTGKTTLLSLLLDRRRQGGQLLDRNVQPGGTLLLSEENEHIWALRQPPLNFGPRLRFLSPGGRPSKRNWRRLIKQIDEMHLQDESMFDLVVIDTIMNFLPVGQNHPQSLRWALDQLRDLTEAHLSVLLIHQAIAARNRRRPNGPLAAFADILIDLQIPMSPMSGDRFTRRRIITGVGRYPGTLQRVTAELNPQGTDYLILNDDALLTASAPNLDTLMQIVRASMEPLTRLEILARWPADQTPPHRDSLTRSLSHAYDHRLLTRTGQGTKFDPFRYSVPPVPSLG